MGTVARENELSRLLTLSALTLAGDYSMTIASVPAVPVLGRVGPRIWAFLDWISLFPKSVAFPAPPLQARYQIVQWGLAVPW
jgi:hypothetical protein